MAKARRTTGTSRTTGRVTVRNRRNRTYDGFDYVYGSAAPKYEYDEAFYTGKDAHTKVRVRKNRARQAHMNPGYVLFMIIAMTVMATILISYISLQSKITSSVRNISSLESQLSTLRAANDEKFNQINSSYNLEEIKDVAITELGMKLPEKDQIIPYTNAETDYV
ncbi:MAG: cell division protein FtsL [Lachnospiraceae bacterium]|nr:cell division protein FtsL [Lachnospiraceae bacterium]